MTINWADIIVAGILIISIVLGLVRGFIREVMAFLVWVLAFVIAFVFTEPVAAFLEQWISSGPVRVLVAFGGLFMVVMLLGGFLNYIVGKAVEKGGISGTDRMLGMLFGTLRGAAVVLVLVLLVGFTTIAQEDWWQESRLIPYFESGAEWVREYFPEDVLENLPGPPEQTET